MEKGPVGMTTLQDMVDEVTMLAFSSMREETKVLGQSVPANAGFLSLASGQQLGSIQPNTILQVDWELYLVTDVTSPNGVTVMPGWFGSQSISHGFGALITVNPRFPVTSIVRAINEDIDDLSSPTSGLFNAQEVTLIYNPTLVGYDMTDIFTKIPVTKDIMRVLLVATQEFGPARQWPVIPLRKIRLERNADTFIFPSGLSLKLYKAGYPGQQVRVSYSCPYTTPLVNPTDDLTAVTGLSDMARDIPVMGAAIRMMEWRDFKRSFSEDQPQTRTATEIPVGSSLQVIKTMQVHRQQRIDAERLRLQTSWAIQNQR
jgi:hypothetical protein